MIVLMVGYLRPVDLSNPEREHDILEFYAGAARLSKLGHAMGANAAAMDKNYDSMANEKKKNNSVDFNTSAGFLSLNFSNGLINVLSKCVMPVKLSFQSSSTHFSLIVNG